MTEQYFEDFAVGQVFRSGRSVTALKGIEGAPAIMSFR